MTSAAPWSVKGIDPKAREVAKDLARRAGMTLGEWLNRMILEDDVPEEVTSEAHFRDRLGQSYVAASRDIGPGPSRYEMREHPSDETNRMALLMDRLAARLEGSERRTGQAVLGVEHSVRQAVERIEAAERGQQASTTRFEGAIGQIAENQTRLAEGLRRVETDLAEPRSSQAIRSLEQALGKVANHLYEGEGRTRETIESVETRLERLEGLSGGAGEAAGVVDEVVGRLAARLSAAEAKTGDALESLRASFATLDGRLQTVEGGAAAPGAEQRLEHLASELAQRVDGARAEMAEKLRASTEMRFDRMELRLGEMADHVRNAEQHSAQAIERIGQEVLSVADALNRRVQTVEQRSAEAIGQVGGEMARVAQVVETRLGGVESVHAEALERLGAEIARITERLGERIGSAERRSAQAIDEVGEQVARVTDKLNQRHERVSEDLLERIRLSEERTARLLEEARERIDQRLAETQRRLDAPVAQPGLGESSVRTPQVYLGRDAAAGLGRGAFTGFGPPEPDTGIFGPPEPGVASFGPTEPDGPEEEIFPAPAAAFPAAPMVAESDRPELTPEDFDAADVEAAERFAPAEEPSSTEALGDEVPADETPTELAFSETSTAAEPTEAPNPESFWSDEAYAATEVGVEPDAALAYDEAAGQDEAESEPARSLTTREVIEQARAAARAAAQNGDKKGKAKAEGGAGGSLFSVFGRMRPKRRSGSTLQTALLVAGGAAFLSMGAAGLVVMEGRPGGETPKRVADALGRDAAGPPAPVAAGAPFGDAPRAAVALSPEALGQMSPAPAPAAAGGPDLEALYGDGVRALEANEAGGLETVRKAANLSYAPAQLYLAKLYESGDGGVKKDLAEARRWTERAAQGGDRKAMHNLALYYFEGTGGGPKDTSTAAQWFRRAADLGLVDSQYNLGRLYEEGIGVSQNAAEAYKWYLIAARSGDMESRTSAQRVRSRLSGDAQNVVERTAAGFRPAAGGELGAASAVSPAVVTAQQALSRLGYYQGPTDGSPSPALRMATAAYQRDQGMAPTGALDDTTVSRLAIFTH